MYLLYVTDTKAILLVQEVASIQCLYIHFLRKWFPRSRIDLRSGGAALSLAQIRAFKLQSRVPCGESYPRARDATSCVRNTATFYMLISPVLAGVTTMQRVLL
jgi:hypothetical protein